MLHNRMRKAFALHRRGGERGTVLVLTSVAVVVAISATGAAVDLGKFTAVKRNLQSVVDLASQDAVRALGDRLGQGGGLSTQQYAEKLAQESMLRNGFDPTNSAHGNSSSVVLGNVDFVTRAFTPSAVPALQNAVKVTATTSENWTFVPGSKGYTASGVAVDRSIAGIAVGSYLAMVQSQASLLNSIIGGFLGGTVTIVGYGALAQADVTLGEIAQELGLTVGSPSELLDTELTLKSLIGAIADALTAQGDPAAGDALALAAATSPALKLRLRDLMVVSKGAGDLAMKGKINVFNLIYMSGQLSDEDSYLSINLSTSSLGALGALLNPAGNVLSIKILQAPRIAIGPAAQDGSGEWVTRVQTSQIRAMLHLRPLGTVLGGILDLPIYLDAATANAAVTGITCTGPSTGTVNVQAGVQTVRARVGTVDDINAANPTVTPATILNVPGVVKVTGTGDVALSSPARNLSFTDPFDWSNTKTVAFASWALGTKLKGPAPPPAQPLALTVQALGLPLGFGGGAVQTAVRALLDPILGLLDSVVLDPFLASLGVTLGGGEVTVWMLNCHGRALAG